MPCRKARFGILILAAAAATALAGCGADPAGVSAPTDAESPAEPPATAPPPSAPFTTAATAGGADEERHEVYPHLFDLVGAEPVIVRAGPGREFPEVTRHQPPVYAVEGTGNVETDESGITWRELEMSYSLTGWVELSQLAISDTTQVSFYDQPCGVDGIASGPVPVAGTLGPTGAEEPAAEEPAAEEPAAEEPAAEEPAAEEPAAEEPAAEEPAAEEPAAADHVAQVWQLIGPGCDRLHIALGTDWGFGSRGPLAAAVPAGTTAEAFGYWTRITVPGVNGARLDAGLDDTWNLTALVARSLEGEVVIDVYSPQPSAFTVLALSNPARLLVDVIASPDSSQASVPVLFQEGATIVPFPTSPEGGPAQVKLPLTVRGYGSWFEASGLVALQDADGTPATGVVTGTRVVRPGRYTNDWGVSATDYASAWGIFEFTLESIDPNPAAPSIKYQLQIGHQPPSGGFFIEAINIPFIPVS